jgi:tetratricopeptide (TPR) repeat protein
MLLLAATAGSPSLVRNARGGSIYPKIPVPAGEVQKDLRVDQASQLVAEGKPDEALAVLRAAAKSHPDWPPARLILARLHSVAGQAPQALRSLELAAAEAPNDPRVYQSFATLALADGRFSDTRLNCERILTLVSAGGLAADVTRDARREAHAGLAAVAEASDDLPGAVAHLRAWLDDDPKNGPVRQRFGRVLFRLKQTDEAFRELKQAVADDPKLEPAAVTMALLHAKAGDASKAEEWFAYARKADPKDPRAPLAQARWLLEQGRAGDALPLADTAAKIDGGSKAATIVQGLIAWHLHDFEGAGRAFEAIHRDAPGDLAIADMLARSLIERAEPASRSRGLQMAEVNARQAPRSAEALATLGRAHYQLGHLAQAEQLLRASVAEGSTSPDIAYFLARLLVDRKRNDEAKALLESAIRTSRGSAFHDDARRLLASLGGAKAPAEVASDPSKR